MVEQVYQDREFQLQGVDYSIETARNHPELIPIMCSPTGSGKTVMQGKVAKHYYDAGDATAILTPRNEIFTQTHGSLSSVIDPYDITCLNADAYWQKWKPVHVVSWPTLTRRTKDRGEKWFPDVKMIQVDECHLSVAPEMIRVLEYYRDKGTIIHGWTATPGRTTGLGLGSFYTNIKHVTTTKRLVAEGYLTPCEYWGGKIPDLQQVRIRMGEYETKSSAQAAMVIVGDVVDNWLRLASDRHTIVFAVDIAHAEALADRFLKSGVSAAALHNKQLGGTRAEIVRKFKAGEIQVLVNVTIASYGFDAPTVNCIVAARPTKSIVLWLQMLGRGMRVMYGSGFDLSTIEGRLAAIAAGPTPECMVLDHADNMRLLGKAEDLYRWKLNAKTKAGLNWTRHEEDKEGEREDRDNTCVNPECGWIFSGQRICPKCGTELPFTKRDVEVVEADLVRISGKLVEPLGEGWPDHKEFYLMLRYYGELKGRKEGWAAVQFNKKAKVWPEDNWKNEKTIKPNKRIQNWITSRNIAFARSRARNKR